MLTAMFFMLPRRPIMDYMKSLLRFVAVAHLSSSAFGAEIAWSVTEERNPLSGGVLGVAQVQVDTVKIMVRCESSQKWIEVRVFPDRDIEVYGQQLTWQFDRTPERSASWMWSPNGRSLIAPLELQDEFIRRLRAHRVLNLSLQRDAGEGDTGEVEQFAVPLNGSSAAIARAVRSCR